jgi:chorismate synthase
VVTVYMKPISTLRKGMPSVDLDTLEPHRSQYERSDVTAVPACGVVAEAMVALVLADALLEKVGGDSLQEVRRHLEATGELQAAWPPRPPAPAEAATSSTISGREGSSPDSRDGRGRSPGGGSEP